MSDRRATTAHGSQQDGADACHAWPSSPSSQLSATTSSHDHASAHRTAPPNMLNAKQHDKICIIPREKDGSIPLFAYADASNLDDYDGPSSKPRVNAGDLSREAATQGAWAQECGQREGPIDSFLTNSAGVYTTLPQTVFPLEEDSALGSHRIDKHIVTGAEIDPDWKAFAPSSIHAWPSPPASTRRATTAHGSQQDGADACHAWPSPPRSQPRIAAPSHYTTLPHIMFPRAPDAAPELRPSVEAVLEYLEDFGQVGGHLASLMGLVEE